MKEEFYKMLTSVLWLALHVAIGSAQEHAPPCPQYDACTADLLDKVSKFTAFPYLNDAELHDLCRSCSDLQACLSRVNLEECLEFQLGYVEGLQKSCGYFCGEEGLRGYKAHRECFNNSELQEEGAGCHATFAERQQSLEHENSRSQQPPMCQYIPDFITCMKNAVTSYCPSEAGEWVVRSNLEHYSPIMEKMSCQSGSKLGVAIIFGTAIGLFTMMMVVIIVSIVCRRKQGQLGTKNTNNCQTFSSLANERKGYKYQEAISQSASSSTWRKSNATSASCGSLTSPVSSLYDDEPNDVKKSPLGPKQEMFLHRSDRTDKEQAKWLHEDLQPDMQLLKCSPSADVVV